MGLNFLLVELATTFAVIGLETAVTTGLTVRFLCFFLDAVFGAPAEARIIPVKATNKRRNWKDSRARFFIGSLLLIPLNR